MKDFGKGIDFKAIGLPILTLTAFFSLKWLFYENMGLGTINEANMLPFALQHVDLSWIPQDWYLNQPPGYRVLFITVFGRMVQSFGLLNTSILGRLLGYVLLASGLGFLSRRLKLSLPLLLLAIALFLYVNTGFSGAAGEQGAAAHEWLIGGVEPKVPAYSLIFYAIGLMLTGKFLWMALFLGLATSFHTLVGGWAFLAAIGWLLLRRRDWLFGDVRRLGLMLAIYVAAGCLAIQPVLEQLSLPTSTGRFPASFTYVFLRTPHHLNPLSWQQNWWIKPVVLLLLLGLSVVLLRRQFKQSAGASVADQNNEQAQVYRYRIGLAEFTLVSLMSYGIGLIIAPFDQEGKILQYYLFRFGDLMLPLNTCLLLACVLEETVTAARSRKGLMITCIALLALVCCLQAPQFWKDARSIQEFPGKPQGVTAEEKDLCTWIRSHTPKEAIFVTSPVDLNSFSWLSERATIAKFRLVPPTGAGIAGWLERLTDLSGRVDPWAKIKRTKQNQTTLRDRMSAGYNKLTTAQMIALMQKYRATYAVMKQGRKLELPTVYSNTKYILYAQKNPKA
jgi:hypothetical protein